MELWNHLGWIRPGRSPSWNSNRKLLGLSVGRAPEHHIYVPFKYLQGWWLKHIRGQLVLCLATLSVKKLFLIANVNLPWHDLRLFLHVQLLVTWEKRLTYLATPTFQVVLSFSQNSYLADKALSLWLLWLLNHCKWRTGKIQEDSLANFCSSHTAQIFSFIFVKVSSVCSLSYPGLWCLLLPRTC